MSNAIDDKKAQEGDGKIAEPELTDKDDGNDSADNVELSSSQAESSCSESPVEGEQNSDSGDSESTPPADDRSEKLPAPEEEQEIDYLVGIRLRRAGRMMLYRPNGHALKVGSRVIVEAERGLAIGSVVCTEIKPRERSGKPFPRVVRIADERDEMIVQENAARNKEALGVCRSFIDELRLPMKLIEVEYQHSANKAIFYFSAEGRIDFRELVRMLAQKLHIRVEMRQVGIRDEAKLVGGLGSCGRPVCCATFLDNFAPVSIRMAKEQNLTLNPEKVSGLCGRLMCCLGYESHIYKAIQTGLPKIGKKVDTWKGRGRVLEINIFSKTIRMELAGREYISIDFDDFRAYKADPEGFAELMEKREEEARRESMKNLHVGGRRDIDGKSRKKKSDDKKSGNNRSRGRRRKRKPNSSSQNMQQGQQKQGSPEDKPQKKKKQEGGDSKSSNQENKRPRRRGRRGRGRRRSGPRPNQDDRSGQQNDSGRTNKGGSAGSSSKSQPKAKPKSRGAGNRSTSQARSGNRDKPQKKD